MLWKKPTIRQYWHKGLLWRASEVEEVASFELFVDLLYVGIIAIIGDTAAENATGFSLLKFTITMSLAFKMWSDLTLLVSWFGIVPLPYPLLSLTADTVYIQRQVCMPFSLCLRGLLIFEDDIFQRILVLFLMICLFGFTLNIAQAFETTWTQLVAFYVSTEFQLSSPCIIILVSYQKDWYHLVASSVCLMHDHGTGRSRPADSNGSKSKSEG